MMTITFMNEDGDEEEIEVPVSAWQTFTKELEAHGFGKARPSLKRVFGERRRGGGQKLRPELEKVLSAHAYSIIEELMPEAEEGEIRQRMKGVMGILRDLAHEMEKAEGEDPSELDPGGPKPGTTGGGK